MEPIVLSVPDACKVLSIARTKLYECLADGRLDSITIDRKRLVTVASIKRLVEPAAQQKVG